VWTAVGQFYSAYQESVMKELEQRQKAKGEQRADPEENGISEFPKTIARPLHALHFNESVMVRSVVVRSRGARHTSDMSNRVIREVNAPSTCNLQNFLLPAVLRIVDSKVCATSCACIIKLGGRHTNDCPRAQRRKGPAQSR
jgi:hypothetical protein